MNIGEFFNIRNNPSTIETHPLVVGRHRVGIEIELENIRNTNLSSPYWVVKGDGSLRNNGIEFVFNGPLGGLDLFNATTVIDTFLHSQNPDDNWRCSTHVHLDVRDMTVQQLKFLILASVVTEKFMFHYSGIQRYKNNFCSSMGFAQGQIENLASFWHNKDESFINSLVSTWDKYSALNFLPIARFGSVEYRLAEAKWRKSHLLKLCNRYLSLKELAMDWKGSEHDLIDFLVNESPQDYFKKSIPKLYEDYLRDLHLGYKLANDILALSKMANNIQNNESASQLEDLILDGMIDMSPDPNGHNFRTGSGCVTNLSNWFSNEKRIDLGRVTRDATGSHLVPFRVVKYYLDSIDTGTGRRFLGNRRQEDRIRYSNWTSTGDTRPQAPTIPQFSFEELETMRVAVNQRAAGIASGIGTNVSFEEFLESTRAAREEAAVGEE